jgi:hypothetical protein
MITGSVRVSSRERISLRRPKPSRKGIITSVSTRSTASGADLSVLNASSPAP